MSNFQLDNSEFALDFKMRIRDIMAEQKMSEDEFSKKPDFIPRKKMLTYMVIGCHQSKL